MKIAIVANSGWYLHNFRLNLACSLLQAGHEVVAIGDSDAYGVKIAAAGIAYRAAPFTGAGTRWRQELACVRALRRLLHEEAVDVVLSYTPKGNIYAGMALWGRPARLIANVSGLGRSFVEKTLLTRFVRLLYRQALARAAWVFFQNREDHAIFLQAGLVRAKCSSRLPGSGVDLTRFAVTEPAGAKAADMLDFLFVGRLLWAKGVGQFVEAARIVRQRHPKSRFRILGALATPSGDAVPVHALQDWANEGIAEYLGTTDDVRPILQAADCVVLPSVYREGVPRSLLEAAASGKPIVTTDAIGCRDTVDDGSTGFLCRPGDISDLARQMLRFAELPPEEKLAMGLRGRRKMEKEFDERLVLDAYWRVLVSLRPAAGAG